MSSVLSDDSTPSGAHRVSGNDLPLPLGAAEGESTILSPPPVPLQPPATDALINPSSTAEVGSAVDQAGPNAPSSPGETQLHGPAAHAAIGSILHAPETPGEHDRTVISQRPVAAPAEFMRSLSLIELARTLEGRSLHHFAVDRMIGGGGMGAVFRGRDLRLDREVAIKVIPESKRDPETLRRFRMEAQSAARLDHPNIARVYDIGEDETWNYIVFEFIDGVNLRDVVQFNGPMSIDDAVFTTRQVAEALQHAHERDVVHRDIKPSNVIITPTGIAKVVDMGLARNTAMDRSTADQTASGVTLGTFDYISPEQARDPRDADVRSDLYSLGCTLFYMLTGQPPFPDGTALQKLLNHGSQPAPDPRHWRDDISDQLAAVLSKLMAKRPSDRYQKPIELINDLMLIAQLEGLARSRTAGTIMMQPTIAKRSFLEHHLPWLIPLCVLIGSAFWLQSVDSFSEPLELPQPSLKASQSMRFQAAPPNAVPRPAPSMAAPIANPSMPDSSGPPKTSPGPTSLSGTNSDPPKPSSDAAMPLTAGQPKSPAGAANANTAGLIDLPERSSSASTPATSTASVNNITSGLDPLQVKPTLGSEPFASKTGEVKETASPTDRTASGERSSNDATGDRSASLAGGTSSTSTQSSTLSTLPAIPTATLPAAASGAQPATTSVAGTTSPALPGIGGVNGSGSGFATNANVLGSDTAGKADKPNEAGVSPAPVTGLDSGLLGSAQGTSPLSPEILMVGKPPASQAASGRWVPSLAAAMMQANMQPEIRIIELHESIEVTSAIAVPRSGLTLRAAPGATIEISFSGADAFGMGWESWIDVERKSLRCQGLRLVCLNDMRQAQAIFVARPGGRIELEDCQLTMKGSRDSILGNCVLVKDLPKSNTAGNSSSNGSANSNSSPMPGTLMPANSASTVMPMPGVMPSGSSTGTSATNSETATSASGPAPASNSSDEIEPFTLTLRDTIVRGAMTMMTMRSVCRAEITLENVCAMLEGRVLTVRSGEEVRVPPVIRMVLHKSTFITQQGFAALQTAAPARAPVTLMRTAKLCVFWSPVAVPHMTVDGLADQDLLDKLLLLRGEENSYDQNIETLCMCRLADGQHFNFSLHELSGEWFRELGYENNLRWLGSVPPERAMDSQLPSDYQLRESMFMPGYRE